MYDGQGRGGSLSPLPLRYSHCAFDLFFIYTDVKRRLIFASCFLFFVMRVLPFHFDRVFGSQILGGLEAKFCILFYSLLILIFDITLTSSNIIHPSFKRIIKHQAWESLCYVHVSSPRGLSCEGE